MAFSIPTTGAVAWRPKEVRAALGFGFEVLGLDEIVSIYEPENVASGRAMQRIGMRRDRAPLPDAWRRSAVYKLLRTQWDGSDGSVGRWYRCPGS